MVNREINLLPPSRRLRLRNETVIMSLQKIIRAINGSLVALTVVGLVAAIVLTALAPIINRGETTELEQVLEDYRSLRETIVTRNVLYRHIASIGAKRLVWTDLLREVLPTMPSGVRIVSLAGSLELDDQGEIVNAGLVLRGQAPTRTTLIIWQDQLRELAAVHDIVSPTSNLLDRTNLNYDVTLILTEPRDE